MDPKIHDAEMFARGAHLGQKHGDRPYWKHLNDTVNVLLRFGVTDGDLLCAAWLHDTIEDTKCTYQDIKGLFGARVAEFVWSVTDEMGRNRKERKERSHQKNFASGESATLKLADLTANVEDAVKNKAKQLKMYQQEWEEIRVLVNEALTKNAPSLLPFFQALCRLIEETKE